MIEIWRASDHTARHSFLGTKIRLLTDSEMNETRVSANVALTMRADHDTYDACILGLFYRIYTFELALLCIVPYKFPSSLEVNETRYSQIVRQYRSEV